MYTCIHDTIRVGHREHYTHFMFKISAMVKMGLLLGFVVESRNVGALNISHLLFAGDTLILSGVN
jgi:hypothetical protein